MLVAEPLTVDALINARYCVLADSDFSVYEVVFAGTVTSGKEQDTNQQLRRTAVGQTCRTPSGVRGTHTVLLLRSRLVDDGVVCDETSSAVLGNLVPRQLCLVTSSFTVQPDGRGFCRSCNHNIR